MLEPLPRPNPVPAKLAWMLDKVTAEGGVLKTADVGAGRGTASPGELDALLLNELATADAGLGRGRRAVSKGGRTGGESEGHGGWAGGHSCRGGRVKGRAGRDKSRGFGPLR